MKKAEPERQASGPLFKNFYGTWLFLKQFIEKLKRAVLQKIDCLTEKALKASLEEIKSFPIQDQGFFEVLLMKKKVKTYAQTQTKNWYFLKPVEIFFLNENVLPENLE